MLVVAVFDKAADDTHTTSRGSLGADPKQAANPQPVAFHLRHDCAVATVARVEDDPTLRGRGIAEFKRARIHDRLGPAQNFPEARHDRNPRREFATLLAAQGRLACPVLGEMREHRQNGLFVEVSAKIDAARNTVFFPNLANEVAQPLCGVAGAKETHHRTQRHAFVHSRRRLVHRKIEEEMAARRGLRLQREAAAEVRYRALGDVELARRQTVGRGHHEHQRLEEFFLRAGLPVLSEIDHGTLAGESLALGEGVCASEVAPDSLLDQAIAQQNPPELHGQRPQRAPGHHRQVLLHRA